MLKCRTIQSAYHSSIISKKNYKNVNKKREQMSNIKSQAIGHNILGTKVAPGEIRSY